MLTLEVHTEKVGYAMDEISVPTTISVPKETFGEGGQEPNLGTCTQNCSCCVSSHEIAEGAFIVVYVAAREGREARIVQEPAVHLRRQVWTYSLILAAQVESLLLHLCTISDGKFGALVGA